MSHQMPTLGTTIGTAGFVSGSRHGQRNIIKVTSLPFLGVFQQTNKFTSGSADDRFGSSTDMSNNGTWIIVGSPQNDRYGSNSGTAYVYKFNGTTWVQHQQLGPSQSANQEGDCQWGNRCRITPDGTRLIVCSQHCDITTTNSGGIWVFKLSGDTWVEEARLAPPSATAVLDHFGRQGDIDSTAEVLVGSRWQDNGSTEGNANVYTRSGTTWTHQQHITPPESIADQRFGRETVTVSGDGQVLCIGNHASGLYMYTRSGNTFTYQHKITTAHTTLPRARLNFTGDTLAVHGQTDNFFIYKRSANTWSLDHTVDLPSGGASYQFDFSDDDTKMIANTRSGAGNGQGGAFLCEKGGNGIWYARKEFYSNSLVQGDNFAVQDIAISGNGTHAVGGAYMDDDNGTDAGAMYVFDLSA